MDAIVLVKPITAYVNFLAQFSRNPAAGLAAYRGKGRLDATLVTHVALAIVFAWAIYVLGRALGLPRDTSLVIAVLGQLAKRLTGPGVTLAILPPLFLTTVLVHLVGKLVARPTRHTVLLAGTLGDSLNASFAFAAFFLPLLALTYEVVLALSAAHASVVAFLAIALPVWLGGIFYYYPSALAAAHRNTSFAQAFAIVFFTVFALSLLTSLWRTFT